MWIYAKELEVTYLWNELNEENTELNTFRRNFYTEVNYESDIEKEKSIFSSYKIIMRLYTLFHTKGDA